MSIRLGVGQNYFYVPSSSCDGNVEYVRIKVASSSSSGGGGGGG